jgi:hypothetical protein
MLRLLCAACAFYAVSLSAQADVFTFNVRSLHPNAVQLKFYSRTRQGHEWPTSRTAWELLDDEVHAISLTCNRNEKICWGAWVKGGNTPEWGVGLGGTDGCQACCFICTNGLAAVTMTLNVRVCGDRAIPTQTLYTKKSSWPPKAVRLDDN